MILRKGGETDADFIKRLQDEITTMGKLGAEMHAKLEAQELINPRTKKSYKEEAEFMFLSIALIEQETRGTGSNVAAYASGTLSGLGYDQAEQYMDKCIEDGAYNRG